MTEAPSAPEFIGDGLPKTYSRLTCASARCCQWCPLVFEHLSGRREVWVWAS